MEEGQMRFELKRQILEQSYEVIMQMGREEKRTDLLAVLLLSKDGPITPMRVNEELLSRISSSAHGKRILENMDKGYHLVNSQPFSDEYYLSTLGQYMLDNGGQTFVPETGCYILHTTDDPLFKEGIIGYQSLSKQGGHFDLESSKRKHFAFRDELKEPSTDEYKELPEWVRSTTGIKAFPLQRGEKIMIQEIIPNGRLVPPSFAGNVYIELSEDKIPIVKADTQNENQKVPIQTSLDLTFVQILKMCLEEEGDNLNFNGNQLVLNVKFSGLSDEEKNTFETSRHIKSPSLSGFRTFTSTDIENIRIFPATKTDAVLWGNWLLGGAIDRYMDKTSYSDVRKGIAAKFGPKYQIIEELYGFEDLKNILFDLKKKKQKGAANWYWYLQAPVDLTQEE
jgi:hypothetical protein